MKKYLHNKGFTLLEILVSMVIIAMVFSSALFGFWKMLETNARIDLSRQLQKEVHFAMIRMADKIRDYSIDYDAYIPSSGGKCETQDIASPQKLCVNDPSGDSYVFEVINGILKMNSAPLLSERFLVSSLNFTITPSADPSKITNTQLQPKVTIYIKAQAKNLPDISISIQTTISSRIYN